MRAFDRNRRRLRELERKNRSTIKREVSRDPVDPDSLSPGDRVKILTLNQNGEMISLPDEKGNLQVQVGMMKIGVNVSDIMLIDSGKPKKKKKKASGYGSIVQEVRHRPYPHPSTYEGKNMDDAVMDVEKYIDDAFISGLKEVTVIHGRGEGILRKGIQDMLKRNRNVDGFRNGGFNEGGDGVTVVQPEVSDTPADEKQKRRKKMISYRETDSGHPCTPHRGAWKGTRYRGNDRGSRLTARWEIMRSRASSWQGYCERRRRSSQSPSRKP